MALLINAAVPAGTDAPSTLDDVITAFKTAVQEIFGLPDNTTISAAVMSVDSGGLQYIAFTDEAADAAAAGRLQRNAANLTFHDGTAARTLVNTATAQTLTNKTLTTPIIATISNTGTLTLPTSSDTLVGRATTDTLTNKTLTAPVLGGSITGTYTLAGTPTITSPTLGGTVAGTPTWASTQTLPALTISGNGAITPAAVSGTPAQHALFRENVVKGRVKITWSGGTPSAAGSFNVSGIVDGAGTGLGTVTWDRDFANGNYTVIGSAGAAGSVVAVNATAVGSSDFAVFDHAGVAAEENTYIIAIGDQ